MSFSQIVTVKFPDTERLYAYRWTGDAPLMIGDVVVVPPNWVNEDFSRATVAQYGGNDDYMGPLAQIVEKVKDDD